MSNRSKIVQVTDGTRYLVFTRGNGTTWTLDKDDFETINYRNDVAKVYIKYSDGLLELDQTIIPDPFSIDAEQLASIILGYVNADGSSATGQATESTLHEIYINSNTSSMYQNNVIARLDTVIMLLEQILE